VVQDQRIHQTRLKPELELKHQSQKNAKTLMEGTIEINGLQLFARHGVFDFERLNGNTFELTVHLRYPIGEAMESDNVEHTLNYAEAVGIIKDVMSDPSNLLEHVIGRIRQALTARWPQISGGYISLTKLNPPINARMKGVAVSISW
jgi:dihydroneopterin aldolase